MKKIIFLIAALVIAAASMAQSASVEILSVETISKGQLKGDLITYQVSATSAYVYGVSVEVVFENGEINGGGGAYNPAIFSKTTTTATHFVALRSSYLNKDRSYTMKVIYDKGYYDPFDQGFVVSEPYKVSK